ncbi:uncharacterized protein LOC124188323 isoform X1 [Daphnia pulex]|uniref:uncharacterized protein LOC124188323 isoform X1 n=1 Tax=Daphnia pulex TaxID=6669 RepID=UPI001EDE6990|nr:uncharacterized protein LOC124188323 isoform X1 [Daphnia pulex]
MAVIKLLGLLLTLQFMMNTVSTAGIKSRQLDIPAFKAFFSQIQSHLVSDKDQGSTGTGAVSVKIEGLNPPPAVSSDWGANSTFVKNANMVAGNDSKFGVSVIRDSETFNRNLHRQNDGNMKGVPVVEGSRPESDFRSISSSSHGSFVLNHKRPASPVIQTGNSLGGKSEPSPFHSHQPAPIQPLKSHPTPQHSPQTTANQAAFTRAVPFQGPTNVRATPTVNAASNDWIPISQPIGSPITTSYSQLSTSRPTSSNGPIFEDTADNFDPFTFNNGNSNKEEKESKTIDSTASNDTNDVVDNHSDPSFLTGFRLKNPEMQEPLYGQVVSPPQNYAPVRKPLTKHTYKSPHPLNINQIIAEAVDHKPPIQQQQKQQQQQQPLYKSSKPSIKGKLKSNLHSTFGVPEKSLKANVGGKDIHNMGNQFPYPPIKTDPSFRSFGLFKGPSNDPQSPVQNNFDDGLRDDVGVVSSFSYFRNQGPEAPGSKGFDQAFNVHAGRNIAKQFKQHMFDQTGFPGKIQ